MAQRPAPPTLAALPRFGQPLPPPIAGSGTRLLSLAFHHLHRLLAREMTLPADPTTGEFTHTPTSDVQLRTRQLEKV